MAFWNRLELYFFFVYHIEKYVFLYPPTLEHLNEIFSWIITFILFHFIVYDFKGLWILQTTFMIKPVFIYLFYLYIFIFYMNYYYYYLFIFRLIQYRLRLGLHRSLFPHIETLLGKTWFKLWSSSDVWQCCLTDPVRQQEHRAVSLWLEVWGVEVCVKWQTMSTHPNEERNISPYICV